MELDSIANGNSIFILLPVVVDQQPQKTPVSCSLLSQPEVLGHEETFFCGTSSAKLPTLSILPCSLVLFLSLHVHLSNLSAIPRVVSKRLPEISHYDCAGLMNCTQKLRRRTDSAVRKEKAQHIPIRKREGKVVGGIYLAF